MFTARNLRVGTITKEQPVAHASQIGFLTQQGVQPVHRPKSDLMDHCAENKKPSGDDNHPDEPVTEVDDTDMPTLEWDDLPDLVSDEQPNYFPINKDFTNLGLYNVPTPINVSTVVAKYHTRPSSLDQGECYSIEDFFFWSSDSRGDFSELHPQTDGEQVERTWTSFKPGTCPLKVNVRHPSAFLSVPQFLPWEQN
ncbi:hypothetical protein B0H13DRAFT_1933431 [Mycena leptocephala]|nr:hypothetical protein B0H13DRAFT_1933431 [Mycena leptocephala]